jgi:xylulokinase
MSDESVLGIDIGTSATKAVLASPDGRVLAQVERQHTLSLPRPGWVEHDAEQVWWQDVLAVLGELVPLADGGLRGICVSGIGPCVVPCDTKVRPLRPAILYGIDTRAGAEVEELDSRYGADSILARGGSRLSSQSLGPKLLWLRKNEPELWRATAAWYMASSFVVARLSGEHVLDRHSASQCSPLYDLESGEWAEDWAGEVAPGPPLPRLVWPAEPVGVVSPAAAAETGLPAGLPVMAGTIDAWAEAFSAGVRAPGDLMLMYGSTMFFVGVVGTDTRSQLHWFTEGVEPGRRTLAAGMATSGSLTDWLRTLLGEPPWPELLAAAEAVPAGSRGLLVLPYLAGERSPIYDPDARGVIAGLTLSHGAAELLRASYEGIAFGIRQVLTSYDVAGASPRRLVAVGGGTRSRLWLQIVSDVTGRAQQIPEQTLGASYGDALLAAIGSGIVTADSNWTVMAETIEPRALDATTYEELFSLYCDLYPATRAIAHRLAQLQLREATARQPAA